MNLPNTLTVSRIFLVPLLLVVLLSGNFANKELWASAIVLLAAATDSLDGYFARRRRQITTLGVLLDPVADKLLISAALISLVEFGSVPAWMAVIIIGREFAISGLRNIASAQGLNIPASSSAKAKMVTQVIAVVLLLLALRFDALRPLGLGALWVALVLAVISGADYFRRFWRQVDLRPQKDDGARLPAARQSQSDARTR